MTASRLLPVLHDAEALAKVVRGAVAPDRNAKEADLAALHRRLPQRIVHQEVRAERRETLTDDLIELGARYIAGLKAIPERDQAMRLAIHWLEHGKFEKPWLLVYDNVEEPGHIEGLTPGTGAHVLLTTRWSDWGKAAAQVGVFPPDVATAYLLAPTAATAPTPRRWRRRARRRRQVSDPPGLTPWCRARQHS